MKKSVVITVRVPADLNQKIRMYARSNHSTINAIIVEILEKFFEGENIVNIIKANYVLTSLLAKETVEEAEGLAKKVLERVVVGEFEAIFQGEHNKGPEKD